MSSPACPECGTLILPGDGPECPVCRRVLTGSPGFGKEDVWKAPVASVEPDLDEPEEDDGPPAERFAPYEESIYQEACAILRQPEPVSRGNLMMLVWLGLVFFTPGGNRDPEQLAIFLGVVLFHELGHLFGMRAFGFYDPRMLFLNFLDAPVRHLRQAAPQWQEAIVILLGPMPGLLAGVGLAIWNLKHPDPRAGHAAACLLMVNAFYMLPLEPLDGGRFLRIVIFSRNRLLEAAFLSVTSVLIVAVGLLLKQWLFPIAGLFGLILVPTRYRVCGAAAEIRSRWNSFPARIRNASDRLLRDLFRVSRFVPQKGERVAAMYASIMKQVHERAIVRPASPLTSLGLLAVYGMGALASMSFLAIMFGLPLLRGR